MTSADRTGVRRRYARSGVRVGDTVTIEWPGAADPVRAVWVSTGRPASRSS